MRYLCRKCNEMFEETAGFSNVNVCLGCAIDLGQEAVTRLRSTLRALVGKVPNKPVTACGSVGSGTIYYPPPYMDCGSISIGSSYPVRNSGDPPIYPDPAKASLRSFYAPGQYQYLDSGGIPHAVGGCGFGMQMRPEHSGCLPDLSTMPIGVCL